MASQVAPGYNPEVSLLQGGNAPIVPVQGGGGMEAGASLPSDYNPSNSLLNVGASATIMPVKGGGQEGGEDEKAYKAYVLERYTPELKSIPLPALTEDALKAALISNIRRYRILVEPTLKKLSSFTSDPVQYTSPGIDNPTFSICPSAREARPISALFFQHVRRRIVTISLDSPTIWIVPDINGDLSKFIQYITLLTDAEGNTKPGHSILFTGTFFAKEDVVKNARLYNEFLERKMRNNYKNINSVFLVNTVNIPFALACCSLYKYIYAVAEPTRPLGPFLEPDIVIFKKQQIVVRGSELPISETDPNVKVSEMLKKTDDRLYGNIVIVPDINDEDELPTDKGDAKPQQKYFTVNFTKGKTISFPVTTEILCPTGKTCDGFQGGYALEKLTEAKLPGNALYAIYQNVDKMPLLKEEGAVLSKENLAKLSTEAKPVVVEAPKATPTVIKTETETTTAVAEPNEEEIVLPETERFEPTPTATKALEESPVSLNGLSFDIRYPLSKGIKEDWQKGKFTEEEARFLNALQLRPSLLNKAFGKKEALKKLADFLEKTVLSNCFQDTTLLSSAECSNSQQFVQQLYFTMLREILETMYDEMGVLKPLNFMDVIQILKNLLKGKGKQVLPLSLSEFTGSLVDPLGKICYDAEKDEYYADFAEIPDDMDCEFSFYRVIKPDVNSIFMALKDVVEKAATKEGEEEKEEEEQKSPSLRERAAAFGARIRASTPNVRGALSKGVASLASRLRPTRSEFRGAMDSLRRAVTPQKSFFGRRSPSPKAAASSVPDAASSVPAAASSVPDAPTQYKLADFLVQTQTGGTFQKLNVKDDGLCFYRSILKGLQANPTANTNEDYDPSKADTMQFVREIQEYLIANKATVKPINAMDETAESIFNQEFAKQEGEEELVEQTAESTPQEIAAMKVGRIPLAGGKYYKMNYDEFLRRMILEDDLERPYPEIRDAGIGLAAATLKDKVLVIYTKGDDENYTLRDYYVKGDDKEGEFPFSHVLFLESKDENHFHLLKLAPGNVWPRVATGGGNEEIFDLGEPIVRRSTRRNKSRKQK
jgi:hypothetical protein